MTTRYNSFQDLPIKVAEHLEKIMIDGKKKIGFKIPENSSMEDQIRIVQNSCADPDYSQQELEQIAEAFVLVDNAVQKGLPNQLYQMIVERLDIDTAQKSLVKYAISRGEVGYIERVAKRVIMGIAENNLRKNNS